MSLDVDIYLLKYGTDFTETGNRRRRRLYRHADDAGLFIHVSASRRQGPTLVHRHWRRFASCDTTENTRLLYFEADFYPPGIKAMLCPRISIPAKSAS